jgi:hypothetical protein
VVGRCINTQPLATFLQLPNWSSSGPDRSFGNVGHGMDPSSLPATQALPRMGRLSRTWNFSSDRRHSSCALRCAGAE